MQFPVVVVNVCTSSAGYRHHMSCTKIWLGLRSKTLLVSGCARSSRERTAPEPNNLPFNYSWSMSWLVLLTVSTSFFVFRYYRLPYPGGPNVGNIWTISPLHPQPPAFLCECSTCLGKFNLPQAMKRGATDLTEAREGKCSHLTDFQPTESTKSLSVPT